MAKKKAPNRILAGARQALAFARGEETGCVVHVGDPPPMLGAKLPAAKQKKPRRKRGSGSGKVQQ